MYWPAPGIERHPEQRWKRPDRVFFGFGACHILAGIDHPRRSAQARAGGAPALPASPT